MPTTPRPSTGVLVVAGDLVEDIVVWTTTVRPGTDNPATVHRTRGGSAANVAALAAARVPTRFLGRVGDDAAGRDLVARLAATGVDVRVEHRGITGTVVVLVDGHGERTMFPDRGAAAELDAIPAAWLEGAAILHVPAYGLTEPAGARALVDAAGHVRSAGGIVSVDVSAVTVVERISVTAARDLFDALGPTILFANAEEAAALGIDRSEPAPGRLHVIKDGPRPAVIRAAGTPPRAVPAVAVTSVRDTTGAGDAFAAGFLAAWMHGSDPVDAARAGHARAAQVLTGPGATAADPPATR